MTLRNSIPMAWRPAGLTDSIESTRSIPGSMASLQNLIPDLTTAGVWRCRPAAQQLVDFNTVGGGFGSGFSSGFQHFYLPGGPSGMISKIVVIGDRVYGLVAGPGGFDYPFCYDLINNVFVLVANYNDQTKLPLTQPQTGVWAPPTMALVGSLLMVTHPGFLGGGSNNYIGWFDLSNNNAPVWGAGNLTSVTQFTSPPVAVGNFNGRAYYLVNPPGGTPAAWFSDIIVPRSLTNANQIITFEDNKPLTALAPLPLQNQVTGGIIQAMLVFKGDEQIYQVTGDAATNNLTKNALNIATGTQAPDAMAITPNGIMFIAPDGLRNIDFNANISPPIGWEGKGKVLPFVLNTVPSRMVGAASGTWYRVTVQDFNLQGAPYVEYWLDMVRGIWCGPMTCASNTLARWNNSFIMSLRDVPGKLFRSDTQVNESTSTFVENGTQLQWTYTTSLLPDTEQMRENAMVETTLYMAMPLNTTFNILAVDQAGAVLGQGSINLPGADPIWGTAVWGAFNWGSQAYLFPRPIPWSAPVVFRRMALSVNGNSALGVRLGAWHCRYEELGYLQQSIAA